MGVTFTELEESELTPYGVSSATVKLYTVLLVKPVTVIDEHGATQVALTPPEVARYVPPLVFPKYVDSVKLIET